MKLKRQTRPPRGGAAGRRGARRAGARPRARMASRPGVPLRRRVTRRLPALRRVLAVVAAGAGAAALVAMLSGPWLLVDDVRWQGARYTPDSEVQSALEAERGRSVLAVDTLAVSGRLEALPAVLDARVSASLTGVVHATLVEREVAFVWETARARLFGAEDGTLFAAEPHAATLPHELSDLPRVTDQRREARTLTVGDRIPSGMLRTAGALAELDPAALGSSAKQLTISLDDDYGFRLRSHDPEWEAAFGVYGLDPRETAAAASARLERQVTAVRTLFASRDETEIGWVDVRNPGKVYFRAKG